MVDWGVARFQIVSSAELGLCGRLFRECFSHFHPLLGDCRVKTKSVGARSRASGRKCGSSRKRDHIRLNPQAPFTDGVLVGNTLYLAGRIGVDETGSRVPDDIETEARIYCSYCKDRTLPARAFIGSGKLLFGLILKYRESRSGVR